MHCLPCKSNQLERRVRKDDNRLTQRSIKTRTSRTDEGRKSIGIFRKRRSVRIISELLTWYARKVSAFCFRIAGSQPRSAFEAGFPETSCWSGSAPRKGIRRLATDGENSAGLA